MAKAKTIWNSLIFRLLFGVVFGLLVGLKANEPVIHVINTFKFILGQIIFFTVPLIIVGFIAPAITQLKANASKMLGTMIVLAYVSTVLACIMSMLAGYWLIPMMNIVTNPESLRSIPELVFKVEIQPIFPVMSALVLSLFLGLGVVWAKADYFEKLLAEANNIVLKLVENIIIPILPYFIFTTFAVLAFEGGITKQGPVFLKVILCVMAMHYIWLTVLYLVGGFISHKNPLDVVKHYGPAYITAVGTMSSAATLSVALECARKGPLSDEVRDFAIPLGATVHLCGSALTETFFVMAISQVLYGQMPALPVMLLFVFLLGIFAVGAPGVPGGTVMASLGIVISILGFDNTGTALLLTIFALQDSFGTACNVTGDAALAMMLDGIFNGRKKKA